MNNHVRKNGCRGIQQRGRISEATGRDSEAPARNPTTGRISEASARNPTTGKGF